VSRLARNIFLTLAAGAALLPLGTGCLSRHILTPEYLAEVYKKPNPERLGVYLNVKLKADYPQVDNERAVEIQRSRVKIRGQQQPHLERISRYIPGKIIDIDTLNEMPRLWITFEELCATRACAYAFVLTEYNRYSLVSVPRVPLGGKPNTTYGVPTAYRRDRIKGCRLHPSSQRALNERNKVLAVSMWGGRKVKTIDLQYRTDKLVPTWRTRSRAKGVK
jgi:hypothetical protein